MHNFLDKIYLWQQRDPKFGKCACGRYLEYPYIYIIHNLKESGLLHESYNMMCCFCHILACIGLEIPEEWEDIKFDNPIVHDILIDYSVIRIKGMYIPTDEYFELDVRIHDTKKALNTGRILDDIKIRNREKWIVNVFEEVH